MLDSSVRDIGRSQLRKASRRARIASRRTAEKVVPLFLSARHAVSRAMPRSLAIRLADSNGRARKRVLIRSTTSLWSYAMPATFRLVVAMDVTILRSVAPQRGLIAHNPRQHQRFAQGLSSRDATTAAARRETNTSDRPILPALRTTVDPTGRAAGERRSKGSTHSCRDGVDDRHQGHRSDGPSAARRIDRHRCAAVHRNATTSMLIVPPRFSAERA
jgi:hypothetical protein